MPPDAFAEDLAAAADKSTFTSASFQEILADLTLRGPARVDSHGWSCAARSRGLAFTVAVTAENVALSTPMLGFGRAPGGELTHESRVVMQFAGRHDVLAWEGSDAERLRRIATAFDTCLAPTHAGATVVVPRLTSPGVVGAALTRLDETLWPKQLAASDLPRVYAATPFSSAWIDRERRQSRLYSNGRAGAFATLLRRCAVVGWRIEHIDAHPCIRPVGACPTFLSEIFIGDTLSGDLSAHEELDAQQLVEDALAAGEPTGYPA